jgi:SOS response regulatory protein OraA/RecX
MEEFLAKFNAGQFIGLAAVIVGPMIAVVAIIASQWRRVRIAEMEGALKQQMLDKGMSAAEIEQVMKAGQEPSWMPPSAIGATGNEAQDKAALVQRMVDNGYEGEDIERVLKAYQPSAKQPEEKAFAKQT